MYTYDDFVHAKQVKRVFTGEVFDVEYVDTAAPFLTIVDEFGDRWTCPASELEPLDCKRMKH